MIASFGLRHIGLVRQLQNACTIVDLKSALLDEPVTPLRAALQGYFLKSRLGIFTYVLQAQDHDTGLRGFAQAKGHPSGLAWNLVCMAPALDCQAMPTLLQPEEAVTVWYRLLLHLCIAAGEHRIQRLFAWVPADSPAEEVFRQAGFAVYCHEQLFWHPTVGVSSGKPSTRVNLLRPENQCDVQKLYRTITPRLVLQAEELNNQCSDLLLYPSYLLDSEQGYALYGHCGEMEGYLHITAGLRGVCLRLLIHPEASDCAAELLDHALAVLSHYPSRPLYCAVRDYEGGLQSLLEERGFALANTYSLLVKHTTVRIKEPVRKLVPALEKKAEIAPTVSRSEAE
ncbi:MAG: hypothetical protein ACPLRM_02265 [Anaerolineae bacterium]